MDMKIPFAGAQPPFAGPAVAQTAEPMPPKHKKHHPKKKAVGRGSDNEFGRRRNSRGGY
jgi:hypothetical protein